MAVKGILFDLGWTLEIPETGDWMSTSLFRRYYPKEITDKIDREIWYGALRKASQPLIDHHRMDTCEQEYRQFADFYYTWISSVPGLTITRERAEEISYDRTYNFDNVLPLPQVKETLQTLRESGYKLGILSDNWPSTYYRIEKQGLLPYFDSVMISYMIGVYKPDERIYREALQRLGTKAEETVFIDDTPKYLDAAGKLGIRGILSLARHPEHDGRYPVIHEPKEIPEIIRIYE